VRQQMDKIKRVSEYLDQQLNQQFDQQYIKRVLDADFTNPELLHNSYDDGGIDDDTDEVVDTIDEAILEQFKSNVKQWMELDKDIKRLQAAIKVRKGRQHTLNEKILDFMNVHNIEDLNTKEGVLRYKCKTVTRSLPQKEVRTKLFEKFSNDPDTLESIKQVFEEKKQKEVSNLRRLKI